MRLPAACLPPLSSLLLLFDPLPLCSSSISCPLDLGSSPHPAKVSLSSLDVWLAAKEVAWTSILEIDFLLPEVRGPRPPLSSAGPSPTHPLLGVQHLGHVIEGGDRGFQRIILPKAVVEAGNRGQDHCRRLPGLGEAEIVIWGPVLTPTRQQGAVEMQKWQGCTSLTNLTRSRPAPAGVPWGGQAGKPKMLRKTSGD